MRDEFPQSPFITNNVGQIARRTILSNLTGVSENPPVRRPGSFNSNDETISTKAVPRAPTSTTSNMLTRYSRPRTCSAGLAPLQLQGFAQHALCCATVAQPESPNVLRFSIENLCFSPCSPPVYPTIYCILFLTNHNMLWYFQSMRHIFTTLSLLLVILISGCTLNFKAKEIELETIPPISYQLNGIQLAGMEVYHGPD